MTPRSTMSERQMVPDNVEYAYTADASVTNRYDGGLATLNARVDLLFRAPNTTYIVFL